MKESFLKTLFAAALVCVAYLAVTPTPLGQMIESGEQRHILAFSVLPLLSGFAWPTISLKVQLAWYAVFGLAIEIAQEWMAIGRNGESVDWLIDIAAASVALAIVALLRLRDPDEAFAD